MLGRVVINPRARTAPDPEHRRSPKVVVLILAAALTWLAGCANTHRDRAVRPVPVGLSPAPTIAPPAEAWKRAYAYAGKERRWYWASVIRWRRSTATGRFS